MPIFHESAKPIIQLIDKYLHYTCFAITPPAGSNRNSWHLQQQQQQGEGWITHSTHMQLTGLSLLTVVC